MRGPSRRRVSRLRRWSSESIGPDRDEQPLEFGSAGAGLFHPNTQTNATAIVGRKLGFQSRQCRVFGPATDGTNGLANGTQETDGAFGNNDVDGRIVV